jgi:hypothetical protein
VFTEIISDREMPMQDEPSGTQPLLPRVRLIWSFVAVTAAAVLIALVRQVDQGHALVIAIVTTLAWLALLFTLFSLMFFISYALGVLEKLLAPPQDDVLSPFAGDRKPEQIVPPLKSDAV